MSLMKMVTKVAIGYALARGIDKVQKGGGFGKMMEGLSGGAAGSSRADAGAGGGLGDMMGGLTGSGQSSGAQPGGMGRLGDMLGQLGGSGGGLGGIGGLLGGLAAAKGGGGSSPQNLEALLGQDNPVEEPPEDQTAGLMLRAMLQAARADGEIDPAEKAQLMELIGDADPSEMAVVEEIMRAPVSAEALAADTPQGMETQVYSMSVMTINPDNQAEAQYLHDLATSLGISHSTVNEIHDNFGAPRLYS